MGLHVNGRAALVDVATMAKAGVRAESPAGGTARLWVRVEVEEAYIHCSKHIPLLAEAPVGENATVRRSRTVDYFGAAASRCRNDEAAS